MLARIFSDKLKLSVEKFITLSKRREEHEKR
jgi:hypothetical protein